MDSCFKECFYHFGTLGMERVFTMGVISGVRSFCSFINKDELFLKQVPVLKTKMV